MAGGTAESGAMTGPAIELRDVEQRFHARGTETGFLTAVHKTSFTLSTDPPRIVSLVGQSGSGKSTLARIVLGLQRPTSGTVTYGGKDIFRLSRAEYDDFRRNVQPVFQDPYAIFNPVYRVDRVLKTAIRKFGLASSKAQAEELMEESLRAVRLDPGQVLGRYPHQLSGGQRQRIMLARVHMLRPSYVIADEPVSMLDAQVRKAFLDILLDFQRSYGMTTLFITHDLSTVYYLGGEVMVITRGRIVEKGPVAEVMHQPKHPYTKLLLASVPQPDPDQRWTDRIDLDQAEREEADPMVSGEPDARVP
ncbi:ABC transporter ATP-binding protein [Thermasporomyces composti]|jgi:ABC-type oligopeptide transport system ATPase subunit|uniref:Peptide/nickel transport system ATP-binding protein n=1 Tax=Thermasporomyces composti TaxID=696763 RepID=A0A3D9V5G8_THECX|nr:ATP-binding cassette domain-containing protein [Thermasporomyces composti]REF36777.1 peptide/nickel transport system ATP-binding protein [Thermasporomyces composti]